MKKKDTAFENLRPKEWIVLSILLGGYAAVFWLAEESFGTEALTLAILPVIGWSWYLGIFGGVLAATLTLLMSVLLFEIKGYQDAWLLLVNEGAVGSFSLYLIAVVVGYFGYVMQLYREAVDARAQAVEKFERQVASLTNLVNIINEVLDADDLTSVLYVLAEETRDMFSADSCLISLWDVETHTYYSRAAVGVRKKTLSNVEPRTENDELKLLQNADVLIYGRIEELSDAWSSLADVHSQGSLLALPLGADGQKIGILQLLYETDYQFTPDELTYAKLVSRQISQAILKLILLTNAQEQIEELSVLHQMAVLLPKENDEVRLLEKTVGGLAASLYPTNLAIALFDEQQNVLAFKATHDFEPESIAELISLPRGVTGRTIQTGVLQRHDDVRKAPDYVEYLSDTRSEICVPIKVGGSVLGIINVESNVFAAFDSRDERILTSVANQVAVALTHIRAERAQMERVREIARSNRLIRALTEVASEMEMSSELNEVMDQMGIALDELRLKILIALFEPGSETLAPRYTSIHPNIIRKLERLSGHTLMNDFQIPVENLPPELGLTGNLHPMILKDYIPALSRILYGFTADTLRRILDRTMDSQKMVLGHFPLVYREKVLGFLWLWGEDLEDSDIPAFSVFANQVAAMLENARLFADVQRLAIMDGLTNIYTRRHFFELAYEEFYRARRYGHPLSILMFDIDHFKKVNDTYGHSAGDEVLAKTAATCRDVLRTNDIVGRYGGEEIVILLVETKVDAAHTVAQRIWKSIREMRVATKKGEVQVTISGGVAGDNVEQMNLIDMIEAADKALYVAKNSGRDRVEIAPPVELPPDESALTAKLC